jgi:hypothetical protein
MNPQLIIKNAFQRRKPLDVAKIWYQLFSKIPFETDLADYLLNHFVISRPTAFMMLQLVNLAKEDQPEEHAWYIRFACGDLRELLSMIPMPLPKLIFWRAGPGKSDRLRTVSMNKMIALAFAMGMKGQSNGQ